MPDTVSDTGPVLHLHEIGRLTALTSIGSLNLPELVVEELSSRGLEVQALQAVGLDFRVSQVDGREWKQVVDDAEPLGSIQPADAQVFVLSRLTGFEGLALTDDLALRRLLESHGATVVGSVGILIRFRKSQTSSVEELEKDIDALFTQSSLHLSHAFRAYVKHLVNPRI